MFRFSLLCALVFAFLLPSAALAQVSTPAAPQEEPEELATEPVEELDAGPLLPEDLLRRMSRIYQYEAEVLDAEVKGDVLRQEAMLEAAMDELRTLVETADVITDRRFRELYRTVVTEYETYYRVSDTLTLPNGTIHEVHAEMFDALNNGPLLDTIVMPDLEPMQTTIPMDMNRLVEQSITYLLKHPEKTIDLWRPRAQMYFPMIEQILREEGVPDELKYLAMIESGLNPRARSWARANGMWQFISATGRAYGLNVNEWVDERLDPEKATRAAARHLKDLYAMFDGDWQLAMAGYNCSPARIRRAIRQAERENGRKATFWDIYRYIPRETRNYVPMFIAASLLISNPDAFNLPPVESFQRYEYEFVGLDRVLRLDEAARMAGTDVETLRALNPEIRKRSTPPMDGVYPLRVPIGTGEAFRVAFAEATGREPASGVVHGVRNGDTLGKIARQYGVSVTDLKRANGIEGDTVHTGDELNIPLDSYTSISTPLVAVGSPIRVSYGTHRVYPVSISQLRGPQPRSEGTLPTVALHTASVAAEARVSTPTTRNASTSSTETRIRYRVRRGDSLGKIAQQYGVSISSLRRWNNIRGSRILVGQHLTIHSNNSEAIAASYRVRKGDSLTTIARKHGVTINQLKHWNNLRSTVIHPGQSLKVQG